MLAEFPLRLFGAVVMRRTSAESDTRVSMQPRILGTSPATWGSGYVSRCYLGEIFAVKVAAKFVEPFGNRCGSKLQLEYAIRPFKATSNRCNSV